MGIEEVREHHFHPTPNFQEKKTRYFQEFMVQHLADSRKFKRHGLLNEEGSAGWKNVARHQLLSAVMTETISELLDRTPGETERLTSISLTHDVDKRRQQESKTKGKVWIDELGRNEKPLVATGSNFTGFSEWGVDEHILRYVDSSVGEEGTPSHWFGSRDPNNLPKVIILPWRTRVAAFKEYKVEEGEKGVPIYGMSTWDKLDEIMEVIEARLFNQIIERHPELAGKYTEPSQLTNLIEDRIHEKIMNS